MRDLYMAHTLALTLSTRTEIHKWVETRLMKSIGTLKAYRTFKLSRTCALLVRLVLFLHEQVHSDRMPILKTSFSLW